ncbi:TPA: ogr/Delta-like zinc finger family protein [Klebsiella pneumoniae]
MRDLILQLSKSSIYSTKPRSWYQCQNLECSCTFTALESVDTIIMKPRRNEQESDEPENHEKQKKTLNRYGSASKLSNRQQIPV